MTGFKGWVCTRQSVILTLSSPSILWGITASSESLIFATDGPGEDDDEGVSSGDYGIDGSAPWYLRVQELAHDSLIAATRAQLARDAKASQDARAASVGNGKDCTKQYVGIKTKKSKPVLLEAADVWGSISWSVSSWLERKNEGSDWMKRCFDQHRLKLPSSPHLIISQAEWISGSGKVELEEQQRDGTGLHPD